MLDVGWMSINAAGDNDKHDDRMIVLTFRYCIALYCVCVGEGIASGVDLSQIIHLLETVRKEMYYTLSG